MYRFISSPYPFERANPNSLRFIFFDGRIVLKRTGERHAIPRYADFLEFKDDVLEDYYIGSYLGTDCYAVFLSRAGNKKGYDVIPLRQAYYSIREEEFALAGRAFQTAFFHHHHLYCGVCGAPAEITDDIIARKCTKCDTIFYPQQAPAVIMSVTRGDTILLARARRFTTKIYSVLAGFVEPGESLEDAVKREVKEECNIEVKNITYFSSQPWPFPNSLMIGFTAEYKSGEIEIQESEIIDAGWYGYDALPEVPDGLSIAGRLITAFINKNLDPAG